MLETKCVLSLLRQRGTGGAIADALKGRLDLAALAEEDTPAEEERGDANKARDDGRHVTRRDARVQLRHLLHHLAHARAYLPVRCEHPLDQLHEAGMVILQSQRVISARKCTYSHTDRTSKLTTDQ